MFVSVEKPELTSTDRLFPGHCRFPGRRTLPRYKQQHPGGGIISKPVCCHERRLRSIRPRSNGLASHARIPESINVSCQPQKANFCASSNVETWQNVRPVETRRDQQQKTDVDQDAHPHASSNPNLIESAVHKVNARVLLQATQRASYLPLRRMPTVRRNQILKNSCF